MRDKRRELIFVFVKEIQRRGTKFESLREFLKNLDIPQKPRLQPLLRQKIMGENL